MAESCKVGEGRDDWIEGRYKSFRCTKGLNTLYSPSVKLDGLVMRRLSVPASVARPRVSKELYRLSFRCVSSRPCFGSMGVIDHGEHLGVLRVQVGGADWGWICYCVRGYVLGH